VIAANGEEAPRRFELPPGTWRVFANAGRASEEAIGEASGVVILPPYSMLVVGR
jgi:hypothetical protein